MKWCYSMTRVATILVLAVFLGMSTAVAGWVTDTTWSRNSHIRTAAITYCSNCSADHTNAASFVGRHYDLVINASGSALNIMRANNPNLKVVRYGILSSFRDHDNELADVDAFCAARGYNSDDMYLWVGSSGVTVKWAGHGTCQTENVNTTLSPGDTLAFCGWSQHRYAPDFRNPDVHAYFRWKFFDVASGADGVMEDEAHYYKSGEHMMFPFNQAHWLAGAPSNIQGWSGYSFTQIEDSLIRAKANINTGTGWAKAFMDTIYAEDKAYLPNITNYATVAPEDDQWHAIKMFGAGAVIWENSLAVFDYGGTGGWWSQQGWAFMDSIVSWDTGYAVIWTTLTRTDTVNFVATDGNYATGRAQMDRLTWYYMAANPERFFFMLSGNAPEHLPNDYKVQDTLFKWFDAIDFNVGVPLGQRYTAKTGTDPAGQSYSLLRRDYSNAIMLYRQKYGESWGSSSSISYSLGGNYRELKADGTLGPVVTSATLRNVEGKIYIPEGGAIQDTIPPGTIQDLGAVPGSQSGTIELTWTATGGDGQTGTAAGYEIYYDDLPINAAALYNAESSSGPVPQAAGSSEAFTLTGLNPGYQYYVAIRAYDGSSNRSDLADFPFGFAGGIRSPAPLATAVDSEIVSATLYCTTVPTYHPALEYDFEIDTSSQFLTPTVLVASTVSDTAASVVFGPLEAGYNYFWRCRATDPSKSNLSTWSGYMAFNLNSGTTGALNATHLAMPLSGDTVTSDQPLLVVDEVPNVSTVFFQVDDNATFDSPLSSPAVVTVAGKSTSWRPTSSLPDGNSWYWRASADSILWTDPVQFSVIAGFASGGPALPPAHAYPNPFRTSENDFVTFTLVPEGANLAILTVSGELVKSWSNIVGGDLVWDGKSDAGNSVASGVYLWYIENFDMKGKLMVIR